MPTRTLYVYAEKSTIKGYELGMNMTYLSVDGKKANSSAGISEDRIAVDVFGAFGIGTRVLLNQTPNGAPELMLNPDLESKLKEIIGDKIKCQINQ